MDSCPRIKIANDASREVKRLILPGQILYIGKVGNQGGFYVGDSPQIFIPRKLNKARKVGGDPVISKPK